MAQEGKGQEAGEELCLQGAPAQEHPPVDQHLRWPMCEAEHEAIVKLRPAYHNVRLVRNRP